MMWLQQSSSQTASPLAAPHWVGTCQHLCRSVPWSLGWGLHTGAWTAPTRLDGQPSLSWRTCQCMCSAPQPTCNSLPTPVSSRTAEPNSRTFLDRQTVQPFLPPTTCTAACLCVVGACGVQLALGSILGSGGARELPCGVFGSFGWSGEAVDEMESKLKDGGYGFAFQPIKVKFKPTTKVSEHPGSKQAGSSMVHPSAAAAMCLPSWLRGALPQACW